jgi:hypothetical protein
VRELEDPCWVAKCSARDEAHGTGSCPGWFGDEDEVIARLHARSRAEMGRWLRDAGWAVTGDGTVHCGDSRPAPQRPSPAELFAQAGGNRDLYRDLLHQYGHLLRPGDEGYDPGAPKTLPCGWSPRSGQVRAGG